MWTRLRYDVARELETISFYTRLDGREQAFMLVHHLVMYLSLN
jgi:hypothetical protein